MEQQQRELSPCACGCGELVPGTWKRGHSARGRAGAARLSALPSPAELDDLPPEDFEGIIDLGDEPPPPAGPPRAPAPDGPAPEPGDDEPPGHAKRDWQRPRSRSQKGKPPRLTVAVRSDIEAKLSFALEIPARIWQARDPVCGGVFVEQRPEIAGALTEIVCQSPDLIAWFSGGGGQFMLWLNVMAALWPVVTVVMAHHVYHSIEAAPEAPGQADYRQYAA